MFLSPTFNLLVEQNLVHLGRFVHFSQKVVGVTLILISKGFLKSVKPGGGGGGGGGWNPPMSCYSAI